MRPGSKRWLAVCKTSSPARSRLFPGKRSSGRGEHCCMASKPLRFHPQAEQEYLTALNWYRERSLTAAMSLEGAFDQALERIREAPYRWPVYFKDFRKYTLRQ